MVKDTAALIGFLNIQNRGLFEKSNVTDIIVFSSELLLFKFRNIISFFKCRFSQEVALTLCAIVSHTVFI